MFETRTTFKDSLFYDISAWTYPMAFHLDYMALNSKILNLANVKQVDKTDFVLAPGKVIGNAGAYHYAMEWTDYYAPKAAYQLLKSGFLVRVSNAEFSTAEGKTFGRGTLLIDKGESGLDEDAFFAKLQEIASEAHVDIHALITGYTSGANLGSTFMAPLKTPQIALLVDGGVDSGEAGEIWHLLDQRMKMPVTLLPVGSVNNANLDRYNVILMADGNYNSLGKTGAEKLKEWTSRVEHSSQKAVRFNFLLKMKLAISPSELWIMLKKAFKKKLCRF